MPRKKSNATAKTESQEPFKNITNQKVSKTSVRKCVVKMQKVEITENKPSVDDSNELKRKTDDDEENNEEDCPSKRLLEEPIPVSSEGDEMGNLLKKYDKLQKVLSDRYVTVVKRLKLDFVPFCAENIAYCHQKHHKKAACPKFPSATQSNIIRSALQQSRYEIFISVVWGLLQKEQFPGDSVLVSIIKLLLTLNPESKHNEFLQPILDKLLWLFDLIVRVFPPCWLALRPTYLKFLTTPIEMSSIMPDKTLKAEIELFDAIIMLLEDYIIEEQTPSSSRTTQLGKNSTSDLTHFDDEYHNMQHWEKTDNESQTYAALSRKSRLYRLTQVLHLIAKVLEMDLAMWILRFHKNPKKHIYNEYDQPLVAMLFSLSKFSRSSLLVKKVMTVFARAVEKKLDPYHIQVLARYISLLGNVQNLCEVGSTPDGILYPVIGPVTRFFVLDLFKTTEQTIKKNVNTYMRVMRYIRCPFVKCEFIDLFLNRLNADPGRMCPLKIVENFRKSRWLECEPDRNREEVAAYANRPDIVYRGDYIKILLYALKAYCEFNGTKDFFMDVQSEDSSTDISQTRSQHTMTNNNIIDLPEIAKNLAHNEGRLKMGMKLREPKLPIPTVNILVNSNVYSTYRTDIKYLMILYSYMLALQTEHSADFGELIEFLSCFNPCK